MEVHEIANSNIVSHKDIARQLNVAQSTVSRALDPAKNHLISPATRAKVLKTAKEMGFRSNIFARRMRCMKSETITLIIDDINHQKGLDYVDFRSHGAVIGQEVVAGVIDGALECDMDVRLLQLDSKQTNNIKKVTNHIGFPYSDGVLFFGFHYLKDIYNVLGDLGVPCLGASLIENEFPFAAVTVNPIPGMRSALRHLLKKGHRRIAYSAHQQEIFGYVSARYAGYELEMKKAGLFDPDLVLAMPDEESIRRKIEGVDVSQVFTAVVCLNDSMADRWRRELKYKGYGVPEDIAIIGCDNNPMFKGLSSVDLRAYELGLCAVKALNDTIKKETTLQNHILDSVFVKGASS